MTDFLSGKRKNWKIQLVRAIAIVCVVMIHTSEDGLNQIYIRPILNMGVGLFLFLSGYLTSFDIKDKRAFYIKRIKKVLFPYIFWITVTALAKGEYKKLPLYYLTSNASAQFYYILVYIQLVLLTPIIIRLLCSKYKYIGWLITPVFSCLFIYLPIICGYEKSGIISEIYKDSCFGWFIYYYLGLALGNERIKPIGSNKVLIISYFISLLVQIGEGYIFFQFQPHNPGTQLKLSSYLSTSIIILLIYNYLNNNIELDLNNRIIKSCILLGDCSFGIYLVHLLIIYGIKYFIPLYNKIPFCLNSVVIITISFICVAIGKKILGRRIKRIIGFV